METPTMILTWLFWIIFGLLVYSYIVYPLLALTIGYQTSTYPDGELPAVSLLVPAHNEAPVIHAKIQNFLELDYPKQLLELVIIDDGSTDETWARAKELLQPRVRLLPSAERSGKAAVMNRLVDAAQFPLLLFSDANVFLSKDAVRRLIAPMQYSNIGAVTGEVRLIGSGEDFRAGEDLYYQLERRIQCAESRIGSVMGVDGGMYLLRKELFRPLPTETILDDFLVSIYVIRAGKRVVYESLAKATESGTLTVQQEFNRRCRITAGAVQLIGSGQTPRLTQPVLCLQFLSHKVLRWVSPILFLSLFCVNIWLLGQAFFYQAIFAFQLLILLALLLLWLVPAWRRTGIGSVLYYFGMSQVAMAVGLYIGLFDIQPPQWEKAGRSDGSDLNGTLAQKP